MQAITEEVGRVAKNLSVGWGNSQYKAVGEADVLTAIKPLEAKYGIYSYPCSRRVVDSGELINVVKEQEKRQLYLRVETTYRFVNVEEPSEYIDIISYGDGVDSQDKAPGKAMTYADKYALLKAYKIQTGDDPDQEASAPLKGGKRASTSVIRDPDSKITPEQAADLIARIAAVNGSVETICAQYKVSALADMTVSDYARLDTRLKKAGA
jgi:hypothetical protein